MTLREKISSIPVLCLDVQSLKSKAVFSIDKR